MQPRWQRSGLVVTVLVLSVFMAAGCGRKETGEKVAEGMLEGTLERATGEDAEVDLGGGDVTIKTEEGTTTMSETAEWPSDMFADVPEFTYGVVERVTRSDRQGGQKAMTVYFRELRADGPESYAKDLESAGWQSQMSMAAGKGGMINAQKGDLALSLMYNNDDKEAVLNVYSGAQ